MADQIYKGLMERFARGGGRYPGLDIPEFYDLARELYNPEEAALAAAMPKGFVTAEQLAETLHRDADELRAALQTMAAKGLCMAVDLGGTKSFSLPPLVPGIFEYQFLRGTKTEKDRRIAKVIRAYRQAVNAVQGMPKVTFPATRVIPVDEKIEAKSTIHTYDQMSAYVESADPISVATCFCRHEAELIDPDDSCGAPNEVCMSFGMGARFIIEQRMGREVSKQEALEILKKSEEAGLVHCSVNRQQLDFVCNCCADHCEILEVALAQPKPGSILNSGFEPKLDPDACNACEECVDKCPMTALAMSEEDVPQLDLDRCIGCGICATVCPTDGFVLTAKEGFPEPPVDQAALKQAFKAANAAS
jgi:Pyruvate/2-oxoacid:ferredoxin oxidoreductase delta subunit